MISLFRWLHVFEDDGEVVGFGVDVCPERTRRRYGQGVGQFLIEAHFLEIRASSTRLAAVGIARRDLHHDRPGSIVVCGIHRRDPQAGGHLTGADGADAETTDGGLITSSREDRG